MAGLLAEQKFHGLQWQFEEDVIEEILAIRAGQKMDIFPPDLHAIALTLLEDDPLISLSEARVAIAYWRNETNAVLDQPRVWGRVERVAKALLRRRFLSPRAVKEVLGEPFFIPALD